MTLWTDLGFRDNPYGSYPVPATEEGRRLLVGREEEVENVLVRLDSSDACPTIDGENGVGKTSVVSVATYRAQERHEEGGGPLLLPLPAPLELGRDETALSFRRRLLFEVARTVISASEQLRRAGLGPPDVGRIDRWMNDATYRNASAGVAGFGVGGGATPNTSGGFEESGFAAAVESWLRECFPTPASGAVVCVLDNVEALGAGAGAEARAAIESLRDGVLRLHGLRWILCGARRVLHSVAASPRLGGILLDPISISAMSPDEACQVVARRIENFSLGDAKPPVAERGFALLYELFGCNLRQALSACQEFALSPNYRAIKYSVSEDELLEALDSYLRETAAKYEEESRGLSAEAAAVMSDLAERGGLAVGDDVTNLLGSSGVSANDVRLQELDRLGLAFVEHDESDPRRDSMRLTARAKILLWGRHS